jgi:hypothetical protein
MKENEKKSSLPDEPAARAAHAEPLSPDREEWERFNFGPCFGCEEDCETCGCNKF